MTMLCYNVKRLQTPACADSPEPGSERSLQGEGRGGAKRLVTWLTVLTCSARLGGLLQTVVPFWAASPCRERLGL